MYTQFNFVKMEQKCIPESIVFLWALKIYRWEVLKYHFHQKMIYPVDNGCHTFSPNPPPLLQDILTQEEAQCYHDNSSLSHSGCCSVLPRTSWTGPSGFSRWPFVCGTAWKAGQCFLVTPTRIGWTFHCVRYLWHLISIREKARSIFKT